jgi:hypothetical protein
LTELLARDKHSQSKRKFYPRNIPFSKPSGNNILEFLILAKDENEAFGKTVAVFSKHNIKLLSMHGSFERETHSLILTFFAEVTGIDLMMEALDREIRALSFVKEVSWVKMAQLVYDQFLFPVKIFDKIRVIVMRADPFLRIEKHMVKTMGSSGSAIMFDEGREYAKETTRQQISLFPHVNPDVLLVNNFDGLRATGWGIFDYRKIENGFEVCAQDLPFSTSTEIDSEIVESRFFVGIITGMIETLYEIKLKVQSLDYDKIKGKLKIILLKY